MWPFRRSAPAEAPTAPTGVAGAPSPDHRIAFILIALGGAAVASFGIATIAPVFSSVFFALILTICVHPVRRAIEARGVPRALATIVVLLAVVALLGAFVAALIVSIGQFLTLLPMYVPQLEGWLTAFGDALEGWGIGPEQVSALLSSFHPSTVITWLGGVVGGAAGLLSSSVIVLTLLILMAADSSYASTITAGIATSRPALGGALVRFSAGVRRYMVVTAGLGAAQGVVNWVALLIMGIPGAPLWGLLSFICSFVPNVGYFIAIVPPVVFAALTGGWPLVVAVIVVYGVFNAVIQSIIQPRVVGDAVSLNQTITFVSVLFWAVVLGPMGAILAVPLTLLVRMILIDADPRTTWVRPALGEVDDARRSMAEADAAARGRRRARREAASRRR